MKLTTYLGHGCPTTDNSTASFTEFQHAGNVSPLQFQSDMFSLCGSSTDPSSEPAPDPLVNEVLTVPKFAADPTIELNVLDFFVLGLFVGALVVAYGIINFEPSPEVRRAMIFSFCWYGGIQVCKSVEEGDSDEVLAGDVEEEKSFP